MIKPFQLSFFPLSIPVVFKLLATCKPGLLLLPSFHGTRKKKEKQKKLRRSFMVFSFCLALSLFHCFKKGSLFFDVWPASKNWYNILLPLVPEMVEDDVGRGEVRREEYPRVAVARFKWILFPSRLPFSVLRSLSSSLLFVGRVTLIFHLQVETEREKRIHCRCSFWKRENEQDAREEAKCVREGRFLLKTKKKRREKEEVEDAKM